MWEGFGDGFEKTLPQVVIAPYFIGCHPLTKVNNPSVEGAEHNKPYPSRQAFLEAVAQQWFLNPKPLHGVPVKTILLFISGGSRSAVFTAIYHAGGI